MPRAQTLSRLLTTAEVANLFSVTTRTIRRWIADGTLPPPLRKGQRCVRWRVEEIRLALIRLSRVAENRGDLASLLRNVLALLGHGDR